MKKFFLLLLLLVPQYVLAIPEIQHWTTSNGARVYFTQATEIPMVDVRIVFDAGAARDGDLPGIAAITNGLLEEGAGDMDADAIAERLEGIGAQLGSGSLRDMAWVSLRSLTEERVMSEATEIVSTILAQPSFDKKSFERIRKSMLVGLEASKQSPSKQAENAFMQAIYGTHPYASPPEGTEASINAFTLDDVREHYSNYYVSSNAVIAIVGDLTHSQAQVLAEKLTGGLMVGEKAPDLPPVPTTSKQLVKVTHPSTQTHVWMGQAGMKRSDPDYYPLYVGNHALGGSGLVSLLSEEVREKRGFAYSVYSYFSPMRELGPFQMALQTKNSQASEALKVMSETAQKFIKAGITEEQLTASKKNITGGFALRMDSNKKLAENLAMIGFYGLPLDYLNNYIARVEAVTAKDVNDAFKRRVHPEKMVTVIVGPEPLQTKANAKE
jgi:zinc protease